MYLSDDPTEHSATSHWLSARPPGGRHVLVPPICARGVDVIFLWSIAVPLYLFRSSFDCINSLRLLSGSSFPSCLIFSTEPWWYLHWLIRVALLRTYQEWPLDFWAPKVILSYVGKISLCLAVWTMVLIIIDYIHYLKHISEYIYDDNSMSNIIWDDDNDNSSSCSSEKICVLCSSEWSARSNIASERWIIDSKGQLIKCGTSRL